MDKEKILNQIFGIKNDVLEEETLEMFDLYFLEKRRPNEIAKLLDTNQPNACYRLQRACEVLAKELGQSYTDIVESLTFVREDNG